MIAISRIEEARALIDPVFLDSPQFANDVLGEPLGAELVLKIEAVNPVRSFKGRGATCFARRHQDDWSRPWICASAGNFGQALAYAARKSRIPIIVFASTCANPLKLERMRRLGADVRLAGEDFDAAKDAARAFAASEGLALIEDGKEHAITEGAGTIAIELLRWPERFDAVLVPVGNGALVNGIGTWMKAYSPETAVIGVGASRAPAMERSFREGRAVDVLEPVSTVADGAAARIPVREAVEIMIQVVDDMLLVEEEPIVDAMRALRNELGLSVEGAGALPFAAAQAFRERFRGRRLALIVTGSNV